MKKKIDPNAPILSRKSPHESAAIFHTAHRPTLVRFQNVWYAWQPSGAYTKVENETIEAEISVFLITAKARTDDDHEIKPFNPQPRDVTAVADMLAKAYHRPFDTMAPPAWLDGRASPNPRDMIVFQNCMIDITTRDRYNLTPAFFTFTALPIKYDPAAKMPRKWLRFLLQVFRGHKLSVYTLQEMFGYLMSEDTKLQKIFFLWGRTRSGKGTILRILTALKGTTNTHYPTIRTLGGRFCLEGCIGKSIIQVTDMNSQSKDIGDAASVLNGIAGEDGQSIERKGVGDWTGILPGGPIIAANNLPNLGSNASAFAARLIIFLFEVSFENREDIELTEKLTTELAGILNWSLIGLNRLRERGRFNPPKIMRQAKVRLLHASDPLRGFVEERAVVKPTAKVHKAVLYRVYQKYCAENGAHALPNHTFSERLSQGFPSVAPSKRRLASGKQVPIFDGIRLNDEEQMTAYLLDPARAGLPRPWQRDADGWAIPKTLAEFG